MTSKYLYAGIVLFNPDVERLDKNISQALIQVEKVILVDNGSENIAEIRDLYGSCDNIYIIENGTNLGIAAALNTILYWGRDNGYEWCLTLDQDSCISDGMTEIMRRYFSVENTALVAPLIRDINLDEKTEKKEECEEITRAVDIITSGSCMNVEKAVSVGGFDEQLFIDYVDIDFNEKLLRAGYSLLRANNAILIHELGHFTKHRFLFWKVKCTNHSAFRQYYITRNRLFYKRKYFGYFGYIKEKIRLILRLIKIIMYEDDKLNKAKAVLKGMHDFRKMYHNDK